MKIRPLSHTEESSISCLPVKYLRQRCTTEVELVISLGRTMGTSFHSNETENANLNQYWYSERTCEVLCAAVRESLSQRSNARVAFLSTPSLFFSLREHETKQCTLFDFDDKWRSCSQFEFYDYNFPKNIEGNLHGKFDVSLLSNVTVIFTVTLCVSHNSPNISQLAGCDRSTVHLSCSVGELCNDGSITSESRCTHHLYDSGSK